METPFRLDHVVILVNDLDAATKNYSALGFTVVQGGEHKGLQTHNALIAFADDSYLELIAFKGRSVPLVLKTQKPQSVQELVDSRYSPVERRVLHWEVTGEGLVDLALLPEAIEADIEAAHRRGLSVEGPFPGSRMRPDGRQVSWQFGIPPAFDLPFLCADVTPRSLRVPGGTARQHSTGAMGIIGITVAVKDLDSSVLRYRALLDVEPQQRHDSLLLETKTADFVLCSTAITLASPTGRNSPLYKHLDVRGEGPYALKLCTTDKTKAGRLEPFLSHGSRIELVYE